jgi:hypothetical protein
VEKEAEAEVKRVSSGGGPRPGQVTAQVPAELLKLSIKLTDLTRIVSEQSAEKLRVSEEFSHVESLQMIDGQLEQLAREVEKCREADEPVLLVELEENRAVEAVAALAGQLEEIAVEWTRKSGRYGGFKRFEGWGTNSMGLLWTRNREKERATVVDGQTGPRR